MNSKALFRFLFAAMLAASAAACSTPRKIGYLLDQDYNLTEQARPAPELRIQPDDIIGISVFSQDAQLAAPFKADSDGSAGASASRRGYTVDNDGNINFPVLGLVNVQGKTLKEIRLMIAGHIRERGYIREPVVNVTLENFDITVIGKTGNSIQHIDGPSINIFQVIARAGGTDNTSRIKDIMVIRTEDGKRTAYKVNLQEKAVFDSPVFYLQQNDIVYVKPRGTQFSTEGEAVMSFVGTGLTLASIITNFILWSSRK